MTDKPGEGNDLGGWVHYKELPAGEPVTLHIFQVVKQADDDSSFMTNCKVLSGKFANKTVKLWWRRHKKNGGNRTDFIAFVKALHPDKWRNEEPIRSLHFHDKYFQTTPKDIGEFRLFTKFSEIEIPPEQDIDPLSSF